MAVPDAPASATFTECTHEKTSTDEDKDMSFMLSLTPTAEHPRFDAMLDSGKNNKDKLLSTMSSNKKVEDSRKLMVCCITLHIY